MTANDRMTTSRLNNTGISFFFFFTLTLSKTKNITNLGTAEKKKRNKGEKGWAARVVRATE